MELHHPNFDDLDGKFDNLMASINLYAIMMDYIKKHRALFYYEGDVSRPEGLLKI